MCIPGLLRDVFATFVIQSETLCSRVQQGMLVSGLLVHTAIIRVHHGCGVEANGRQFPHVLKNGKVRRGCQRHSAEWDCVLRCDAGDSCDMTYDCRISFTAHTIDMHM